MREVVGVKAPSLREGRSSVERRSNDPTTLCSRAWLRHAFFHALTSEFHVEDPPRVLQSLNVKIQKIHAMKMVLSFYSQPY